MEITIRFPEIELQLTRIADALEGKQTPLPMPGAMIVNITGESENNMLKFTVDIPDESTADVVKRVLTVDVDGTKTGQEFPGRDAAVSNEFQGDQGATVMLSLVNVDDADNKSEARELMVTLTDTLAPPMPGEFGITVTGEEP